MPLSDLFFPAGYSAFIGHFTFWERTMAGPDFSWIRRSPATPWKLRLRERAKHLLHQLSALAALANSGRQALAKFVTTWIVPGFFDGALGLSCALSCAAPIVRFESGDIVQTHPPVTKWAS
jgi:hypothetical protein